MTWRRRSWNGRAALACRRAGFRNIPAINQRGAIRKDFRRYATCGKSTKRQARVAVALAHRAGAPPAVDTSEAHMLTSPEFLSSSSQNCGSNASDRTGTRRHPGRALLLEDVYRRACIWIAGAHRDPKLSPAGISRQLRCSRATLYRAFQSKVITVVDHIQRLRLERIRAELMTAAPRIPISSIALDHGFECLSHFHRRFKQLYGCTPGETRSADSSWRREVRS